MAFSFKNKLMSFIKAAQRNFSAFEKWFEKKFSWFFTNGYKDPVQNP
jgi:hypothetical protein